MSEKVVEVMMGSRKVGRLALSKSNQALFEYDSDWIRNGFSISPFHLPLESKLFTADAKPFDGNFENFAFIHRNGIWQLAPAYDVLPCEGLGGFHSLSVNGNYKNPGKEDAVLLAEKFGLRKDETEEIYEGICKTTKVM